MQNSRPQFHTPQTNRGPGPMNQAQWSTPQPGFNQHMPPQVTFVRISKYPKNNLIGKFSSNLTFQNAWPQDPQNGNFGNYGRQNSYPGREYSALWAKLELYFRWWSSWRSK